MRHEGLKQQPYRRSEPVSVILAFPPNLSKHPNKRNHLQNSWSCQKPPLWAERAWF